MRTYVSLGLCALLLGFFSSSLTAGNVEECEFLKDKSDPAYSPGLYGLCVAYANADSENARLRISENYADRNRNQAPTLEEIFDEGGAEKFSCICWPNLYFVDACTLANDADVALPGANAVAFIDLGNQMATFFGADADSCGLVIQDTSTTPPTEIDRKDLPTSGADAETCQSELAVIATLRDNAELCDL